MAHSNIGGYDFAGDVTIRGVLACDDVQTRSSSGTTTAGAITSSAAVFALTAGVTPGSPAEGMIYANSTNHHLYYYSGAAWVQLDN